MGRNRAHHRGGVPVTDLRIARLAAAALVEEVYTTPKPGLVDLNNTGAHRDMTVQTFLYSAAALEPYFREMAELGRTLPQEDLLPALRASGIRAAAAGWGHGAWFFFWRWRRWWAWWFLLRLMGPGAWIWGRIIHAVSSVCAVGLWNVAVIHGITCLKRMGNCRFQGPCRQRRRSLQPAWPAPAL